MVRLVDELRPRAIGHRCAAPAIAAIAVLATACSPETSVPATGLDPLPPPSSAAVDAAVPRTAPPARTRDLQPQFVPGELMVKLKPGTAKTRADSLLRSASVRFSRRYRTLPDLLRVSVSPDTSIHAARVELERNPEVEYAEPNYLYVPHVIPNDQWFHTQENLHHVGINGTPPDADIDAPEAWDITQGDSGLVVAVLDTGIFANHEDLAANVFRNESECTANGIDDDANGYVDDCHGIDALEDDTDATDFTIHGTHVAGTIGAETDNGIGIAGVAWNVRILPCRFIDPFQIAGGSLADAVECLDYVAMMKDRGVKIVATNNSWGGIYESRALNEAIAGQLARGILTVASAGNDSLNNDREPVFPCNTDHANVICVASVNTLDLMSGFSNYGVTSVHLSAPGEYIYAPSSSNGTIHEYHPLSGTSMASPHVAGVAVLLAAQDPARDWRAIRNLLIAGARPIEGSAPRTIARGTLNALESLQCINKPVTRRLKPHFLNHVVSAGTSLHLRAINIDCAQPRGNLVVEVSPSGETVTLRDDGAGDDEVAGDGVYAASWIAPASGDHELRFPEPIGDVVTVHVDPFLKAGFPLKGTDSGWFAGFWDGPGHQVMAGNIDADPELEVLIPSVSAGPLYAFNHDGTAVPGWPLLDFGGQPYAALGEFDGDPAHSEVANNNLWTFGVSLYRGNAELMPGGWPKVGRILVPPATHDLDGDGFDEVILYPAYRSDGSIFNPDTLVPTYGPEGGGQGGSPASVAVGDTDGDGLPEMATARYGSGVWLSNASDVMEGFPARFPDEEDQDGWQLIPVIGDVDADGAPEIVVATNRRGLDESFKGYVHVFSNRGVHERMMEMPTHSPSAMAAVLADLDGDGVPEILVQNTRYLYAWKGDGSAVAGWPVFLGATADSHFVSPVVGDVDGDGLPDVVTTAGDTSIAWGGKIYRLHRDGRPHEGFPRALLSFRFGMAAAIADIDLDGRNDLLVAPTSVPGVSDTLYGYDYNEGNLSGPIEWGQYMEGPENRGFYELGKNLTDDAFVSAHAHGQGHVRADDGEIDCGSDCIGRYSKGQRLTLRATALPGGQFGSWAGACAGQGNPCVLTVDGPTSLAANFRTPVNLTFSGSGAGTVRFAPTGQSCTDDCSELLDARTVVTLTAEPAGVSGFDGWRGACTNSTGECRLYMDAAKSVTALFVNERLLTLERTGSGSGTVTSSPNGIHCGTNCDAEFAPDSVVSLMPAATPDSSFRGWTGGACHPIEIPCRVTMDSSKVVGAVFDLKPVVSVSSRGGGRVTSSPAGIDCGTLCAAGFEFDESVTLTASADAGTSFVSWSGDCSGSHATCVLSVIDGPRQAEAVFSGSPSLNVFLAGGGSGRVISDPAGIDCTSSCSTAFATGTNITLRATPASGSQFIRWQGACSGSQTACRIDLRASSSVQAVFELSDGGGGGGGGSGGGGALGWASLLALLGLSRLRNHRR